MERMRGRLSRRERRRTGRMYVSRILVCPFSASLDIAAARRPQRFNDIDLSDFYDLRRRYSGDCENM
jgi:hypothetical protein